MYRGAAARVTNWLERAQVGVQQGLEPTVSKSNFFPHPVCNRVLHACF
jgi:hypothetical protein